MSKRLSFLTYTLSGTACAAIVAGAVIFARETGGEKNEVVVISYHDESFDGASDWSEHIFENHNYSDGYHDEAKDNDSFEMVGYFNAGFVYGKSRFTNNKYRLSDIDTPQSQVIKDSFVPSSDFKMLLQGHAGKRLTVYIDHDSKRENQDENKYTVQYRAVQDDEVLRELNAGDIDINVVKSKYAIFESKSEKAYGLDVTFKKNNFEIKGFGSVAKGSNEVEQFKGRSATGSMSIAEYQYIRDTYFQLEPYRRFDNIKDPSSILFPSAYTTLVTFTSKPTDPYTFTSYAVPVESGSVEIWRDDQSGTKKNGIFANPPDGGSYVKLIEGTDFTVNYASGEIVFLKSMEEQSRIFVGYRLSGGATASSDPAARTDIIPGKIFIFIKYGTQLEEDSDHDGILNSDRNSDGKINHDIYEIKSRYYLGDKKILPDNFSLLLYRDNKYITASDMRTLGRFSLDSQNGIIGYYLREPFRSLLSIDDAAHIYGVYQSRVYDFSHYSQKVEYCRSINSYQLKHTNVISGSVSVKVNGIVVSPSVYTVNLPVGLIEFPNSGNPVIGDTTPVEISYQYSTQGSLSRGFVGGFRSDYRVNESLSVGGTLLYSQQGSDSKVPFSGEEPTRIIVLEGDSSLNVGPSKFGKLASAVTGENIHDLPLEFNGYAEYAKSYRDTNTFGKMMIDDIESASDATSISLYEKDWTLSSMPPGYMRGLLYYKYYRKLSSLSTLQDENFSPYIIDYTVKPGPYNIQGGHTIYSTREMNSSRRSLVFDFDFTASSCASAAVRIDKKETDLSGLQYVEVWYRAAAGSGDVDLSFDIGAINEDSDGDGILDTEDKNQNGYIDVDPNSDLNEDVGYTFNPSGSPSTKVGGGPKINSSTIGDGVLTTEDFNGNGLLDTTENIISLPGSKAFKENETSYSPITVVLSDTLWKSTRIYIRKSMLTETDFQILAHSRALRINIKKGTASAGKIWIDSINLVSTKWGNVKIDNVANDNPDKFKSTIVDTLNDSEYRNHSFLKEKRSAYESLYGDISSDDLNDAKESALSLQYNLSGSTGSVSRKFQKAVDLNYYKTLSVWINPREIVAGDTMNLRIGSSDNDYITYSFPLDFINYWQELTFRLKDSSSGKYAVTSTTGSPVFSRIKYIRLDITSAGSGTVWVNNIMALDPQKTSASAYWYEGTLKSRRPLYIMSDGTPVANNILISYVQHRHDAEYSSPGRTDNGLYERSREIRTSCALLPHLESSASFVYDETSADSFDEKFSSDLRGYVENGKYLFQLDYGSASLYIPSVWLTFSNESKNKSAEEYLQADGSRYISSSKNRIYSPRLAIEEKIVDFFGGRWIFSIISDNTFQLNAEKKTGSDIEEVEKEERQKNELKFKCNYEFGYFSVSPEINMFNNEVIQSIGKSSTNEIAGNFNGSFHFPFFGNPDNFKYSERKISGSLKFASRNVQKVSPSLLFEVHYLQNNFYDYIASEKVVHQDYVRQHGAQSASITEINVPFTFSEPVHSGFKSLSLSYNRKIYFDETSVPYEGEDKGMFNERYGLTNFLSVAGTKAYNLINFYPGYFLIGRGSFARGRDTMRSTLNNPIYFQSGDKAPYSNSLKLMENFSISPVMKFKNIDLVLSTGFDHLCERSTLEGVPGQQLTFNSKGVLTVDIIGLFASENIMENNKKRSTRFSTEYGFSRMALITSNIREDHHSPGLCISFLWDDSILTVKGSLDYRIRKTYEYISTDPTKRSRNDDLYFDAMSTSAISEKTIGYTASIKYETDLVFLYNFFSSLYALSANPRISVEYEVLENQYDYKTTISPEPYDRHLVTSKLSMDVHKNIKGAISGRMSLEKWYNRETKNLYREVFSYELGGQITLQW